MLQQFLLPSFNTIETELQGELENVFEKMTDEEMTEIKEACNQVSTKEIEAGNLNSEAIEKLKDSL